jgi:hypothetical protein
MVVSTMLGVPSLVRAALDLTPILGLLIPGSDPEERGPGRVVVA